MCLRAAKALASLRIEANTQASHFGGKCVSRPEFQSFQQYFPCGVRGSPSLHGHYLNCILVETTLCDIIFMHYVLNIIYQLYREDNASTLTARGSGFQKLARVRRIARSLTARRWDKCQNQSTS